ncbi:ImmA/IrrE family metallo-endopeptidase [Lactobacillus gallinarum]|uniref:ImmA/IrrE family metallo-endopeptidase n=2 Tax=Lactobacillus gallinarum TaxID=52242 RepID=A0A1Y4W007_9LACO|nr:ImmA/IrrE family metallo-endopeptidase [Lactobacillus gallinarum]OUQ58342.1 ImmA/IrrE family metallo-endopeptidase [Lactobacillus gallinarum]OUQ75541.1 ImmA/IrrE family metallo-endopeptidase [Lactobacillus gallinarum]
MRARIKHLLNKYHLKLVYKDIEGKGYIIHTPANVPDFIFVKENLSDEETEKVILHEVGHAENDDNVIGNYKTNSRAHDCYESGANKFVVSEKVKEYANLGYDTMNANWLNLAQYIGTDNYWLVREELQKYRFKG